MTVVNPSTLSLMDSSHSQAVLANLSEQRSQGLFCDVIIIVEDVKFHAHRNILAATSGYFRNAFKAPDVYTSGQVLELKDLKSEVFANILNFIYSAKVESSSAEDSKSLVAAGKRLGIPFLEKLLDTERQNSSLLQSQESARKGRANSQLKLADTSTLIKKTFKPEESDCSKVPRITNAFSITEAGAVNNPFCTLDQRNKVIEALKGGHPPSSPQTTSISPIESEPANALSEHSYAVSQGLESNDMKEVSQENDKRTIMPAGVPAKASLNRRLGPIKKRLILSKGILPLSNDLAASVPSTGAISAAEKATVFPLSCSQLPSDAATEIHSSLNLLPPLDVTSPEYAEPPSLSPQNITSVPTLCCQHCSETFSDSALFAIHMQIHKKFVSHLFCKFCRKKFMHLKRLRNHEQVCVKSLKGPSELETNNKESLRVPASKDTPNAIDMQHSSPPELHFPLSLDPTLSNSLEMPQHQVNGTVTTKKNSRAYKCSVCRRAYVTFSSLKRHENVHSWHRAYPCHYCNKVFALAEYRTKHEIWHTGERRYQCIFCLETFLTYYILKNHQKSFHGIDPSLAVNTKPGKGGLKSSIHPIKLYRLLPMKLKKKRYKSYSQTYSEGTESHEDSFSAPLDSSSPHSLFDSAMSTKSDVVSGQSLFSMPVTFMATPKMMASETPRISFDKPSDQNLGFPVLSGVDKSQKQMSAEFKKKSTAPGFDDKGSPHFSYRFTDSSKAVQKNTGSSLNTYENDTSSMEKNSTDILPFLNIPSVCSFEGLSRLSELSAAAQTIEDMANQLLQARPESIIQSQTSSGKTETYIAKPACPGPSIDSQVLPLCQITVKIGNEAIVRRKIKGSKLFPKKRKRKSWRQESIGQSGPAGDSVGNPSLRLRTEVTKSVTENESYDDPNDPETDKLWRPYYTYKPKKKNKKMRCKEKRIKPAKHYTRPLSPEANEDLCEKHFCADENISAENYEGRREQRHSSQKEVFPCHSCDISFPSQTSLSRHIFSCHQPCCRICGKQCSPKDTSSSAHPYAEDNGNYICKSCTEDGSCFSSDVASHSLSTEKRYRCSYCPQRFLYLATKNSHEKKHLEKSVKGHHCRYCSKVCKSALLLDVHENKHFKTNNREDPDIKCKKASSFSTSKDGKRQIKPEPWENTYTCSEIKPKMGKTMDRETVGNYPTLTNIYKKKSLSFPEDKSFLSISPEIKRRTSKKKIILEHSKGFGFEGHKQGPVGAVIWGP